MQRQVTNESGTSSGSEQPATNTAAITAATNTTAATTQQQTTTTTTTTLQTSTEAGVVQARSAQQYISTAPQQHQTAGSSAYSQTATYQPSYHSTQGATYQQQYTVLPATSQQTTGQQQLVQQQVSVTQLPAAASSTHYSTGATGQVYYGGASTVSRGQSTATETSRVVGVEYGEQRVISVSQRVDESRQSVLSERYVEHEIKVPKKIVREEVIEKVIIVPEKIIHEEIIDEIQKVREKVIEIARPTIIEKVVEVPEIEYVEKIVEVPEKIVQEKIVQEVKVQYQERIVEVPKPIYQERIIEVPEVQYREVPVERIVEVPEYKDEIVYRDVPVTQYVEKPVPEYVTVEVPVELARKEPIPVEAEVTFEYRIPQLKASYGRITYPVYLPRFIEVPVAAELLNEPLTVAANNYIASIQALSRNATSLCEIEDLATKIMRTDFHSQLEHADLQTAVLRAWESNVLKIGAQEAATPAGGAVQTTVTTTTGAPLGGTTTVTSYAPLAATASVGGSQVTGAGNLTASTTQYPTQYVQTREVTTYSAPIVTEVPQSTTTSKKSKKSKKSNQ
eukprot:Protomagalhaensia_sp_Gyna_25__625@NODE_1294_length_1975_cov_207_605372_g1033_i0_p2_GENE_NODE_1294_length_1975_cov_207_605372_g1033_i0NODE_1294_length_1975_cov_207_605372_g1033_i0_p2_ORF_typecomplete_len564_score145_93IMCp/PF12314_8/6_9e03IMCp/PF12314_8/3_4e07IMCp/PF12314_8/2_8e07IMCp/PF12314_8/5_1e03IMCp/PF12314_8/9_4e03_NODE_1294_length_1975_cov_207_605372_g1033_i01851876